ncbi:alpha amylase catalytic region [Solidesulfovibrio fructosivorans JJ]]|uniref:Alpha amylase catalytic region n=1 Tax=Solidesulfovibrio fructosivorans JJ] TaxID=596151 RepID=E1K178_SOLFR|nr:alpha-amylase family glycosyl hydrolase [Solidesulfovibrio fructosivorans]EFL49638.1 alpha amylase catalytic region [Solidesulfovibrio fructosivorans JJ]]
MDGASHLDSVYAQEVNDAFAKANTPDSRPVKVKGKDVAVPRPYPSPVDWRDEWIYFIMVDRFNNPDGDPRNMPFDAPFSGFQGGTLTGITARLDYLHGLGVGALWVTPVVMGCPEQEGGYHGYGFQNPLEIDPRFGTEQDLVDLVDAAHARGMRVILDVVLNHAGDVFAYDLDGNVCSECGLSGGKYPIQWRDEKGHPMKEWSEAPAKCPPGAAIGPKELRDNAYFRRQGAGSEAYGDFCSLKEFVTDAACEDPQRGWRMPVRDTLIRAYQYLVARYDVDGLRIDTLKYVEPDFARIFGNAMREYAASIGKANFFTYGEIWEGADNQETIKRYIGAYSSETGGVTGVDAALDFPLFFKLRDMLKGSETPAGLARFFEERKHVFANHMSSHGEASRYFVTFLDNHDQKNRFYYRDPQNPHAYDAQLTMAMGLLFTLQGIPCLYYGTEQGLCGMGDSDTCVREALWGLGEAAFDAGHPFYQAVRKLSELRNDQPALRYGRQYFRPVSGDGVDFGISPYPGGVLAFSRILNDREVLVVGNTSTTTLWSGEVLVDYALNAPVDGAWKALYSNRDDPAAMSCELTEKAPGACAIDGRVSGGAVRAVRVALAPMELAVYGR